MSVNTTRSTLAGSKIPGLEESLDKLALSPRETLESTSTSTIDNDGYILQNRDIPTEIWLSVFRYAVDAAIHDYISEPLRMQQSLVHPPITLSHVCRRWRSIVHDFPDLWLTIPTCPRQWWTRGEASSMELSRKGAEGALAHSDATTSTSTRKPVTLLLDVSERFDSKESISRDHKSRDMVPVLEPKRTLEGRKSLLFPKDDHNVYIFLRAVNPDLERAGGKVHPRAPVEIRHLVRIGGAYAPKPTSLTLHWPQRSDFSNEINSLFYSYQPKNVTLIDNFPTDPWEAGPRTIKTLRLKTTERQRLVSLNGMLRPWIEELFLHSCQIDVDKYGPYLSNANQIMSNLRVLGITPVHVAFFTEIKVPSLEKVIFYPPNIQPRSRKLGEEWLATVGGAIKSITQLEFEGWPEKYRRNIPYYSIVPLLLGLLHHLPALSKVVCRQSFVWGDGLAEQLPLALADTNDKRLEAISFEECTGLTQAHCDRLAMVANAVKVL